LRGFSESFWQALQVGPVLSLRIPLGIPIELGNPEIESRLWGSVRGTSGVAMPEAAVHEQGDASTRKHQIWNAGQGTIMRN